MDAANVRLVITRAAACIQAQRQRISRRGKRPGDVRGRAPIIYLYHGLIASSPVPSKPLARQGSSPQVNEASSIQHMHVRHRQGPKRVEGTAELSRP